MAAGRRRDRALQPRNDQDRPLSIPGQRDPLPLAAARDNPHPGTATTLTPGLVESHAVRVARPVRAGGLGKRTGGDADTAPQADPTGWDAWVASRSPA